MPVTLVDRYAGLSQAGGRLPKKLAKKSDREKRREQDAVTACSNSCTLSQIESLGGSSASSDDIDSSFLRSALRAETPSTRSPTDPLQEFEQTVTRTNYIFFLIALNHSFCKKHWKLASQMRQQQLLKFLQRHGRQRPQVEAVQLKAAHLPARKLARQERREKRCIQCSWRRRRGRQ